MKKLFILLIINQFYMFSFCQPKYLNTEPDWSPDGQKIVFVSKIVGNYEICSMNKDGSNLTKLTATEAKESDPSFSPDGEKILFLSERDGVSQVYIMNIDGSNQINLTKTNYQEFCPCWSPRGDKIAFQSSRDETSQIYIMNTDGSNCKRISNLDYNNSYPKWSADGEKLMFQSIKLPQEFKCSILYVGKNNLEFMNLIAENHYMLDDFSKDSKFILYHSIEPLSYLESTSNLFLYNIELKSSEQIFKNIKNLGTAQFMINEDSILLETNSDLCILNIIDQKMKIVIENAISPKCSPQENTLLFVSSDKRMDICTIKVDGLEYTKLTKK